jgi:hypothetical protein
MPIPLYYLPSAALSSLAALIHHSLHLQHLKSGLHIFLVMFWPTSKTFLPNHVWSILIMWPNHSNLLLLISSILSRVLCYSLISWQVLIPLTPLLSYGTIYLLWNFLLPRI